MKYNGTGFDNIPDPIPMDSYKDGKVPVDRDSLEATMRRKQRRGQPFTEDQTACAVAMFLDPTFIELKAGDAKDDNKGLRFARVLTPPLDTCVFL